MSEPRFEIDRSGRRFSVTCLPPIAGTTVMERFDEFETAAAYATGMAYQTGRVMMDRTGRLTDFQCAALVAAHSLDPADRPGRA